VGTIHISFYDTFLSSVGKVGVSARLLGMYSRACTWLHPLSQRHDAHIDLLDWVLVVLLLIELISAVNARSIYLVVLAAQLQMGAVIQIPEVILMSTTIMNYSVN
jgi:hypothetical protein